MPDNPRTRFGLLGLISLALFAALFARLWFLQVMTSDELAAAAESNRVRVVIEEAPRGRILDRNGKVIVDNRRSAVVTVDWQAWDNLPDAEATDVLERLARELNRDQAARAALARQRPGPGTVEEAATETEGEEGGDGGEGEDGQRPPPTPPITVQTLRDRLADPRFSHFKPVPVAQDVGVQLQIFLTEHAEDFPTVAVERQTIRNYQYGQLLAHVLGYVGPVNEEELAEYQNDSKPYENDDQIGKGGIERAMERDLRGIPGEVRYEVDARNRPVRVLSRTPPVAGNDVYLTVDIDLQAVTEEGLEAQILSADDSGFAAPAGSAVVVDPNGGQVLAMASYPTYNPGDFIGGITNAQWQYLNDEENFAPIVNRAIQGQYAPGSTFKLVSSYSGLHAGLIQPGDTVDDGGVYQIPGCGGSATGGCTRQNAGRDAKGTVDLQEAITVSSDVYYYQLGYRLWAARGDIGEEALQYGPTQFGFGADTGVALPSEQDGRIPTPEYKAELAAELYAGDDDMIEDFGTWYAGDNLNVAIGQGDVLVTPLQLANAYATFANGGTLHVPQFVRYVTPPGSLEPSRTFEPEVIRQIDLPPEWRAPMLAGFEGVTSEGGGTATETFSGFPQDDWRVAGKTGTAQVNDKDDTSLFVGFGPSRQPTHVVAAILEEAGNGGDNAAPLVRRILEPVASGGLPPAPAGGRIDAEAESQAENTPPPSSTAD